MATQTNERPRGFATEMARAIGWLAVGAGVAKLPTPQRQTEIVEPARSTARPSTLLTAFAALVGLVLAFIPRRSTNEEEPHRSTGLSGGRGGT